MAPEKLNDSILESILWNKVPVELQQEVKEITDGSVQELLMKLLRAESVVAERKCRSRETTEKTPGVRQYVPNRRSGDASNKSEESRGPNAKDPNQKKILRENLLSRVKLVCNKLSAIAVRQRGT